MVIGGVSWSLYAVLGGGTWFQPFLFFVVSVVLGSIVWGISEIINLHAQQIDIQLRLEEKLRKLVPETPAEEKPVEFCAHCVAGWAALIIGLVWSVVNFIFVGWIALLFWLIVTFFLTVLLFGLVEVLERLEDQELKLLALRDSLEKLMKQEGLLAEGPQQCRRCGTQLPPGGKTCPTCHYVNE